MEGEIARHRIRDVSERFGDVDDLAMGVLPDPGRIVEGK